MQIFRRITKPVSHLVVLSLLALNLYLPAAQASMVGTETVINAAQSQQYRERVQNALNRDDVQAQLLARGVDPAQIQARVNSLTDEEMQTLATNMDQLPAGGDSFIGALVFIFIVLLITDLLGLTSIFPFVKHPR
jgi:hypothetical protein